MKYSAKLYVIVSYSNLAAMEIYVQENVLNNYNVDNVTVKVLKALKEGVIRSNLPLTEITMEDGSNAEVSSTSNANINKKRTRKFFFKEK